MCLPADYETFVIHLFERDHGDVPGPVAQLPQPWIFGVDLFARDMPMEDSDDEDEILARFMAEEDDVDYYPEFDAGAMDIEANFLTPVKRARDEEGHDE